jgi:hypothetical protein
VYNPHGFVLVFPQEKKVRFEGEVKEMNDDEVRSLKWDGAELKVIFYLFNYFYLQGNRLNVQKIRIFPAS